MEPRRSNGHWSSACVVYHLTSQYGYVFSPFVKCNPVILCTVAAIHTVLYPGFSAFPAFARYRLDISLEI